MSAREWKLDQMNSIYFGGGDCRPMAWDPNEPEPPEGDPADLEAKARELAAEGFSRRDVHAQKWLAERSASELLALVNPTIDYHLGQGEWLPMESAMLALQQAFVDTRWECYGDAALDLLQTA